MLVVYGKHKYRLSVAEASATCATVKQILVRDHVNVPVEWCRLLVKAREVDDNEAFSAFCNKKRGKATKLRLQFTRAFAELGAGERDRRLQCGSSRSNDIEGEASNARASSASRSSMQISSGQSQSPSMVESECEPEQPESWAIGATVIHGKRKHQFYFENFEIATIAALQDGIRERVGVAVKRQRLLVRGVFVGEGTRSGCNAPTLLADLLPSSRQKKAKGLMVKVRLIKMQSIMTLREQ